MTDTNTAQPILEVTGLGVDFWVDGTWYPAAVDMDYTIQPGEVLAIVGESGSGKSTSSMALLGLLPMNSGSPARSGSPAVRSRRCRPRSCARSAARTSR